MERRKASHQYRQEIFGNIFSNQCLDDRIASYFHSKEHSILSLHIHFHSKKAEPILSHYVSDASGKQKCDEHIWKRRKHDQKIYWPSNGPVTFISDVDQPPVITSPFTFIYCLLSFFCCWTFKFLDFNHLNWAISSP